MSARLWSSDRPVPSWKQLCVLVHHVFERLGTVDTAPSDAIDETKWDCARAGFDYPPGEQLAAAVEAVRVVRQKGYATPRQPHRKPGPPQKRRAS